MQILVTCLYIVLNPSVRLSESPYNFTANNGIEKIFKRSFDLVDIHALLNLELKQIFFCSLMSLTLDVGFGVGLLGLEFQFHWLSIVKCCTHMKQISNIILDLTIRFKILNR